MTENDRLALNWLSTRVTPRGQIAPGHEDEQQQIIATARTCKARGLTFKPGTYVPLSAVDEKRERGDTDLTCRRCHVTYTDRQYHCCVCGRVFRSVSAFEKHQNIANGESRDDRFLIEAGMAKNERGAWVSEVMEAELLARLRAINPKAKGESTGAA